MPGICLFDLSADASLVPRTPAFDVPSDGLKTPNRMGDALRFLCSLLFNQPACPTPTASGWPTWTPTPGS